jgi:hypothetical protein
MRARAIKFIASLGLMIGASLSLGFMLGRASVLAPHGSFDLQSAGGAEKISDKVVDKSSNSSGNAHASRALSPGVDSKVGATEPVTSPDEAVEASQPPAMPPRVATIINAANADPDPASDPRPRDKQHWLKRSEEARREAEEMHNPAAKREMGRIADAYERVAENVEDGSTGQKHRRQHRSRR